MVAIAEVKSVMPQPEHENLNAPGAVTGHDAINPPQTGDFRTEGAY